MSEPTIVAIAVGFRGSVRGHDCEQVQSWGRVIHSQLEHAIVMREMIVLTWVHGDEGEALFLQLIPQLHRDCQRHKH